MRASGRVVGLLLLGAAVVIGVLGATWPIANVQDDELSNAAAVFAPRSSPSSSFSRSAEPGSIS